jgi:aminoglycoside 3-N-acetyltransferase
MKTTVKETLKVILRKYRKIKRRIEIKVAPTITKEGIKRDLRALGVCEGDVVLIHSSMKRIGYVDGGAIAVLEALMESVSTSGTLVIPTYHTIGGSMYATCQTKNYMFDPRTAPTHLGAIPSAALQYPGVIRSIHPTHSVSAIGKDAKYITEAHHLADSTFGKDSPWDRLVKLDGRVLGLGVSMGPVTFYHMVEDMMLDIFPLPARMKKTYFLKCRDWNGKLLKVPVNPLDPQFAKLRIDQNNREDLRKYFWNEFTEAGLLHAGKVGQATSWLISSQLFYKHLVKLAKEGITVYSSPDELKRRPLRKSKNAMGKTTGV